MIVELASSTPMQTLEKIVAGEAVLSLHIIDERLMSDNFI